MPRKKNKQQKGDEARRPAPDESDHISPSATVPSDPTKVESANTAPSSPLSTSAPDLSSGPSTKFHVGATVNIYGLNATQYNGLTGTIVGAPAESSSRVCVRLTTRGASKTLALQQANLTILVTPADLASLPLARTRSEVGVNTIETSAGNASRASPWVSDDAIISACACCDTAQLRLWGQLGFRLTSVRPVRQTIAFGAYVTLILLRCLVNDLHADINQGDVLGLTALHVATDRPDVVLSLVKEFRADVNKRDNQGAGPLFNFARVGDLDGLRHLVKFGADLNQTMNTGITPLFIAAQFGHVEMLRCMVELRADVNHGNDERATPLHLAAQSYSFDVVRCLLELRANVIQGGRMGTTPLHTAAKKGRLDVVRCLLKFQADVNSVDDMQQTPLMMASFHKHSAVVHWLVKAGADAQAKSARGWTAADASKDGSASAEQTAYLEAKAHCSKPGCSGAGIRKCTGCRQVRYCGEPCQLVHWKAHKTDCKTKRTSI